MVFLWLTLAAALAPDPSAPMSVALEDPPLFPLADVKPGMRGIGYTVFSSLEGPKPFDAEILGVMPGFLGPGEDLIIARLSGKQIERTGVISGMSGSPVYIDGKLVGAVGYRFGAFTKEPIAGITPIERMLASSSPATWTPTAKSASAKQVSSYGQVTPITTPVSVSGVLPHVIHAFQSEFEARGYAPVAQTGGSSSSIEKPMGFFAGGPIAANLIGGDMLMSAIGTVTWVKGNRFVAFGHPFLGVGQTAIPVGNAEIVTTVASEAGSWKMGQARATVGGLTDDRLHAISGVVGEVPTTIPLHITLRTQDPLASKAAKGDYQFRISQHPTDTPMYCALAIAHAMANRLATEQHGGTVDAVVRAQLSTGDVVTLPLRASGENTGFELPVAITTLGVLAAATDQDFIDAEIVDVRVDIDMRRNIALERIVSVDVPDGLQAGASTRVRVRVQPFQKAIEERFIQVRVPAGVPAGSAQLVVVGAADAKGVEREIGLTPQPTSFHGLLRALQMPPPGSLSVYLVGEGAGIRLDGHALPGLPASIAGVVAEGGGLSGGVQDAQGMLLGRLSSSAVVVGEVQAKVMVRGPE